MNRRPVYCQHFALLMFFGLVYTNQAYAENGVTSSASSILQVIIALVLVLGMLLLSAWGLKRIGALPNQNKIGLKIIGGVNLGQREKIMVVEVDEQWLVLGVTAQSINLLTSIPKQSIEGDTSPAQLPAFQESLKKLLGATRNSPTNSTSSQQNDS